MLKIEGPLYQEDPRTIDDIVKEGFKIEEVYAYMRALKYLPYDEIFVFDLKEQTYKKRKVYFHISPYLFSQLKAVAIKGRTLPVTYLSMNIKMCVDLFKHRYKGIEPAFLYRCVNNRAINLFNPASEKDLKMLWPDPEKRKTFMGILDPTRTGGKSIRNWLALEFDPIMKGIDYRMKCDGIALEFYEKGALDPTDNTEGFCLFERGLPAITIAGIARIENIHTTQKIPAPLKFINPGSPEYREWIMELINKGDSPKIGYK